MNSPGNCNNHAQVADAYAEKDAKRKEWLTNYLARTARDKAGKELVPRPVRYQTRWRP